MDNATRGNAFLNPPCLSLMEQSNAGGLNKRQQAVNRAGGPHALCATCSLLDWSFLGVRVLGKGCAKPIKLAMTLAKATESAGSCWLCGWLASIAVDHSEALPEHIMIWSKLERVELLGSHKLSILERWDQPVFYRQAINYHWYEEGNHKDRYMKGFIQKAGARRPISVSVMLDSGNFDGAEPYTARLRPPMADPRLFRFWKDWCMREHQGHCGRNEITTGRSMASIRLVDVFENCVATLDVMEHVEWVALSYVWGEAQAHALVKGNYNAYHEQGALKFDRMPATILDAMWVTRELGERYLWIDSLCIIQDDEDDKLQYIPAMDIIYSQSIITIVNAATDKVSSGIPGIRQGAPRSEQDVFELNGTWLTLSLDPAHSSNNAYLNQTKWATRGWTYQECLLSRRCLIFTKEQAYWQCLGSSFCEDTNWEIRSDIHPVMYRHCLGNSWPDVPSLQALYGNTDAHWSRVYPMAVEQFRQRQLTSDHDRLHAFTGILRALEYSAGLKTFWGMPIPCLQRALVWTELEPLTRNTSSQSIRPNGEPCPFPSWSWVGWSGPISIDVNRTHEIRGRLYFRYYSLGHEGDPIPLTNRSDDAVSCFDGSDEDRWFNPTQTEITRLQIPDSVRSSHAAPGLLCFWTSTAVLNISLGDATQIYHSGNLIDGEIKVSSHMAAEEPCLRVKQGRFIVIDAATRREPRPVQPVLKVMLVDEDDSGVCYRRFLFTNVCPFRWARLENLKWEVVCLG